MTLLRSASLCTLCLVGSTYAQLATLTVPSQVVGDGDGNRNAPWISDGSSALVLQFDTTGLIPAEATIRSVTVRADGSAISPSYRSEIDLTVGDPAGNMVAWDFGEDLGFPDSSGSWDSGSLTTDTLTGSAAGLFSITFSEDLNDNGDDNRIAAVSLTVDYALPDPIFSSPMEGYLNGVFPLSDPTDGGAQPPATLSATGAFANLLDLQAAPGLVPYQVNAPLWSDGAAKRRWIAIPSDGERDSDDEQVTFRVEEPWTFPAGTVAIKHFELATNANDPNEVRRLETRFLVAIGNGDFYGVSYRWRPDGSDADLLPDGATDSISLTKADGSIESQTWDYPSRQDCRSCHNLQAGVFLGVNTWQLNGELTYPGEDSLRNQLTAWSEEGLFAEDLTDDSSNYPAAVAIDDSSASLEHRTRSYLASNCASCHHPDDGLNTHFDLRYGTPLDETGLIYGDLLYDLGITGAHVITPREPARSIVHRRMDTVDINRMPPIGRNLIDAEAVAVIEQWILTLDPVTEDLSNPPMAFDDEALTRSGQPIAIEAFSNDSDVDGDSFFLLQASSPSHGTTSWNAEGVVTYSPENDFVGVDQFSYQIVDSSGKESQLATIRIVVTAESSSNSVSFTRRSDLLADSSSFSGVAMGVVDMNQDGRDDIVRLRNARDLFVDYQEADGSFSALALGTPAGVAQWGLAIGDADNNGYPDIVTGGFRDGLHYQRADDDGNGFEVSTLAEPIIFLQAISFADIDNDGWLDLFPCHDLGLNPPFRNTGDGSLVHDASLIDTSTTPVSDNSGNYGVIWTDYDGDGDIDLYISKCREGVNSRTDPRRVNQLFRKNADGTFTEVASAAGLADGAQSWTADFADIDNDGDLDCFIGNHSGRSRLMRNDGSGTFSEVTASSGIDVSWDVIQSIFRDFNNDGWIDLLLTGARQGLWVNDRDGTFTLISNPFISRAMESAAVGDLNHDGFPDIYAGYARLYNTPQSSRPDQLFLSENNGNGFLSISLEGRESNRLASGAMLELHGPWGVQLREVRSGEGYGITNSFSQRFGMGNVAVADKLVVRWPSGTVDTAYDLSANQFLTLSEGDTAAPSLANPGDRVSAANSAVSLLANASDPDGNALIFSASGLPTGLSIEPTSGLISGTTSEVGGIFATTLSVTDGWSTVSQSFAWTVTSSSGNGGNGDNGDNDGSNGGQSPFGGNPVTLPGRIEAEEYDLGANGEASFDLDPENIGRVYRADSVDLTNSLDNDGTFAIGWIENSEWTEYSVVVTPGNFDLTARVASAVESPGLIRVLLDGRQLGILTVVDTGDWHAWETILLENISIVESGPAILRLEYIGGPYNLNWIEFSENTTGSANNPNVQRPFLGQAAKLPGRVQAENYDLGGSGVAFQDQEQENQGGAYRSDWVDIETSKDIDGSFSLGWFDANEWVEYTVTPLPGTYTVTVRTAAGEVNPGDLRVLLEGQEIARFDTPDTGGPTAWASTTQTGIVISDSDKQVMRIETIGNGINLNWIEFVRTGDLAGSPLPNSPLSEEALLATAFGSSLGNSGEAEEPLLTISPPDGDPSLTFLIRLGGWHTETGYLSNEIAYNPQASRDLQSWEMELTVADNPGDLPVPPSGYKYLSYSLLNEAEARAFFRVEVSER